MAEIRYYRKKTPIKSELDDSISDYFNAKYGQRDIDTLLSTNGENIVCKFNEDISMSLQDIYGEVGKGLAYISHYLIKIRGSEIIGIVKFKLNVGKPGLYVEYLCSSEKGSGAELLNILKEFRKPISLIMMTDGLNDYYKKQGFLRDASLSENGRIWKGGRRTRRRKLYTRNNGRNKVLW